jgi:hypothetical protein
LAAIIAGNAAASMTLPCTTTVLAFQRARKSGRFAPLDESVAIGAPANRDWRGLA